MGSVKERPNLLDIFVFGICTSVFISKRTGSIVLLSLGDWLRPPQLGHEPVIDRLATYFMQITFPWSNYKLRYNVCNKLWSAKRRFQARYFLALS